MICINKKYYLIFMACSLWRFVPLQAQGKWDLNKIQSPVVLAGNDTVAYRDPAVLYWNETFYLFYTMMRIESDSIFAYVAQSESADLVHWTDSRILTQRSQELNYSSPGNVIRFKDEWVMCLQSYPRKNYTTDKMPRYGDENSRIYTMKSKDLYHWSEPVLLKVKGDVPFNEMGRMIDPFLLEDKDDKGRWWCFYKQKGVSMSYSYDLEHWTFAGHTDAGENVCVLADENGCYLLFHSPQNGIGIKYSYDLRHWEDTGTLITLGQKQWKWAAGRITAGMVCDCRNVEGIGKYLMFFHGSGPSTEPEGDFDKNSSIGIAWSDDLFHWDWKKF